MLVEQAQGDDFSAIGLQDVKNRVYISTALADYYAAAVDDVARDTGVDEMAIRRWFEQQLITREGFRTQTLIPPESGHADSGELLRALQATYLVRAAIPRGTSYLTTHSSALSSTTTGSALQPWQLVAREWSEDRQRTRLLAGPALRAAKLNEESLNLTNDEPNFLDESERAEKDRAIFDRIQRAVWSLRFVVVIETALIVVLLIILIAR
jgi:hypothetical protein